MASKGRQPVAQGGMWSTPQPTYSKETQNLLKEMMRESKLTNFQQRQLDKVVKGGGALPESCNPTTSAKPRAPRSSKKVVAPKVLDGRYTRNIRTQDMIEDSGAYDRPKYVPQAPSFYDKDKNRLQNMMAYGEDIEPQKVVPKAQPVEYKDVDRFDELQSEIEERRAFLEEMESLGRGDKFKSIIATEISQKIREMEIIDQKRTKELERVIAAQDRAKEKGIPKS